MTKYSVLPKMERRPTSVSLSPFFYDLIKFFFYLGIVLLHHDSAPTPLPLERGFISKWDDTNIPHSMQVKETKV